MTLQIGHENTICFPIIRQDFILTALESLRRHTPANFKTIVVNQTQPNPRFEAQLWELSDIVIRPHLNYGFAQASNLAMRLAPTPYVTVSNDDIEFLDNWWEGVTDTFRKFPRAIAVAPMSPKEPGWGYGEPGYRYLIPSDSDDPHLAQLRQRNELIRLQWRNKRDEVNALQADSAKADKAKLDELQAEFLLVGKVLREFQAELEPIVYAESQKPEYIEALVRERNNAVIDGIAMWLVVFKRKEWEEVGMFDERFFPGGGEDYDLDFRIYDEGYRAVASSLSWVWHHWGKSKDDPRGFSTALPNARGPWNKLSTKGFGREGLYHPDVDVWARSGTRLDSDVYRAGL